MTAPTQRLRDLIEEIRTGCSSPDDLHNELMNVERALHLPLTEPSEWGTMTPEEIAEYQEHERTHQ